MLWLSSLLCRFAIYSISLFRRDEEQVDRISIYFEKADSMNWMTTIIFYRCNFTGLRLWLSRHCPKFWHVSLKRPSGLNIFSKYIQTAIVRYLISWIVFTLSSQTSPVYLWCRHYNRSWRYASRFVHPPWYFGSFELVSGEVQVLDHLHNFPFLLYVLSVLHLKYNFLIA